MCMDPADISEVFGLVFIARALGLNWACSDERMTLVYFVQCGFTFDKGGKLHSKSCPTHMIALFNPKYKYEFRKQHPQNQQYTYPQPIQKQNERLYLERIILTNS